VGEEVDDGGSVGLGAAEVLLTGLGRDERPAILELVEVRGGFHLSCGTYSLSMLIVGAQ
jgi:hypothetical protein